MMSLPMSEDEMAVGVAGWNDGYRQGKAAGRREMAREVIDRWDEELREDIADWLLERAGDAPSFGADPDVVTGPGVDVPEGDDR